MAPLVHSYPQMVELMRMTQRNIERQKEIVAFFEARNDKTAADCLASIARSL